MASIAPYTLGPSTAPGDARMHLNEFQWPSHPSVTIAAAVALADGGAALYPERGKAATGAIARYLSVSPENVTLTAGSDEALRAVLAMIARGGTKYVVGFEPTYTHFIDFVAQAGLHWCPIRTDPSTPLSARVDLLVHELAEMRGERPLVYLVSPGNPLGEVWTTPVLRSLAAAHSGLTFIVDEAYTEFEGLAQTDWLELKHLKPADAIPVPEYSRAAAALNAASFAHEAARLANVYVTRTFSKAFGLAGLRVGYVVAEASATRALASFVSPKSVTAMAEAAAAACLAPGALGYYFEKTARAVQERGRMRTLLEVGWPVVAAGGNFLLIYAGDAPRFVARLAARGIHVRDRSGQTSIDGHVRITVGNSEFTARLLEALKEATDLVLPGPPVHAMHTPKSHICELRCLLARARPALDKARLTWWAADGTLLGAVRHGGIIPWDNDIDLGYLETAPPVDVGGSLFAALAERGLRIRRNRTGAYWQIDEGAGAEPLRAAHIDLFPYDLDPKTGYYLNADPRFRYEASAGVPALVDSKYAAACCNTRYLPSELAPLVEIKWYNRMIPVPAGHIAVLNRALGPDWRTSAVVADGLPRFTIREFAPA